MSQPRNYFAALAAKASRGDSAAQARLREQMESQMVFIVRRTIQSGQSLTSLDRRIHAEALRLGGQAPADLEQRIRAIARTMSAAVLASFVSANRDKPQAQETLVEYGQSVA